MKRKVNEEFLSYVEKEIIAKDREFFGEIISFRGMISGEAENQAWIDWASELYSIHKGVNETEAEGIIYTVLTYYLETKVI